MLESFKQYLYLVVDQGHYGVLARCRSLPIAHALAKGMTNSSPMVIQYNFIGTDNVINNYGLDPEINLTLVRSGSKTTNSTYTLGECNLAKLVDQTRNGKLFDLVKMPTEQVTTEWIEKRRLANLRSVFLETAEEKCERYMSRSKLFSGDEIFLQYVSKELTVSDPEKNIFSNGIKEWALINNISNDEAYNHLYMLWESTGINVLRINAVWHKYCDIINTLTTKENLVTCVTIDLESELRSGPRA